MTALVMGPVWSHFQNLCINYNIGQLNKSALNTTNLKYKALIILPILFYILFRIWDLVLGSYPDLSFWIIIYRKIVDPAKRENLGFGS